MAVKITVKDYMTYIELVTQKIQENKVYISELDAITGDGDHWANMNMGFGKLVENKTLLEGMTFNEMFKKIGQLIMSTVGGSSGVLYGSAYLRASKVIGENQVIDLELLSQILEAKLVAIMERGNAKPGFKTMIDALHPAVLNLQNALKEEKSDYDALQELKIGAIEGMNQTRDMEAVKGRACYQANKGVGHLDPGAVTMCYQLEVLVDFLCSRM